VAGWMGKDEQPLLSRANTIITIRVNRRRNRVEDACMTTPAVRDLHIQ